MILVVERAASIKAFIDSFEFISVTHTKAIFLVLDFLAKAGKFKTEDLAKRLNVEKFDTDESFSDKLNLPSSVFVKNKNPSFDRIRLRAKEDFDFTADSFSKFLKDAYKAYQR